CFAAQAIGDPGDARLVGHAHRALVRHPLERRGHAQAVRLHLVERAQRVGQTRRLDVDGEISGCDAQGIERGLMQAWRKRMGDGMAEDREETECGLALHPAGGVVVASLALGTAWALAVAPMRKKSTADHTASSTPTSSDSAMPVPPM